MMNQSINVLYVEKRDCSLPSLNPGAEVEPSIPLQGTGEQLPSQSLKFDGRGRLTIAVAVNSA
jgi:hypothetical protein